MDWSEREAFLDNVRQEKAEKGRGVFSNRAIVMACMLLVLLGFQTAPATENPTMEQIRQAAEEGNVKAQYNLGLMYSKGQNVAQDLELANRWYRKAAEQGYPKAQYGLGLSYIQGRGVMQDGLEAAKWFRMAAEQGLDKAQYNLGLLYDRGQGVAQNVPRAARWYRKAADQGFVEAQYNLAVVYERGRGNVDKDLGQAVKWYKKAADQDFIKALHNLGVLYAQGRGVTKNEIKAYTLFSQAAAQGHSRAKENKEVLEKKMGEEKLNKARKQARQRQQP